MSEDQVKKLIKDLDPARKVEVLTANLFRIYLDPECKLSDAEQKTVTGALRIVSLYRSKI